MQTMSQSVRKAVSVLIALLLTFALFPPSSAAPISDTFTYDPNGNMLNGSGFAYEYNDANQLVKIINESDSSTVAEYFYDSNGQRVKKIEGGVTTYYIGEYAETRVNGSTVDNTSYYFANNERVARKDPDGSKFYYHGDHLGSAHTVTDETGAQSEKVSYYPYGSIKERVGEGSTYLFTDQEFDDESGLYYYGARYYNPELTRFTQPDTITQDIYNPQNLNRYAYVLNNPLKYTDPTGNIIWFIFIPMVVGGILAEKHYLETTHNPTLEGTLTAGVTEATKQGVYATTGHLGSRGVGVIAEGSKYSQFYVGGAQSAGTQIAENLGEGRNIESNVAESFLVGGSVNYGLYKLRPGNYEHWRGRGDWVQPRDSGRFLPGGHFPTESEKFFRGGLEYTLEEASMYSIESLENCDSYSYDDLRYPYGAGADPSSYTTSTNYYPPEWEEKR